MYARWLLGLKRMLGYLQSVNARFAGTGLDEIEEEIDRRRLACPVRPEQAEDLTGLDRHNRESRAP